MVPLALAAALAAVPGLYALLSGRTLVRQLDDPSINELNHTRGQRLVLVSIVALAAIPALDLRAALGLVPIAVLGALLGSFPARRALFGDTWGPWSYVAHTVRFWLGLFGPWLLLVAGPVVLLTWPAQSSWLGPVYVTFLAAWGVWGGPLLVRLLGGLPLSEHPDASVLAAAFEPVLEAADCARPKLMVTPPDGGRWANAFAVPTLGVSVVMFSDGLLADLEPDEAVGILAHELAHLEEFRGGRWLRRALIPAALGLAVWAAVWVAGLLGSWAAWLVPVALLIALLRVAGSSQKRESESDARAVELTGDPEALARALEKIHARARMPRRVDADAERRLTHPSLARRLQAIRGTGRDPVSGGGPTAPVPETGEGAPPGVGAPEPEPPLRVDAARPKSTVLFLTGDRLLRFDHVPEGADRDLGSLRRTASGRSLPYGTLRELRVIARGSKRLLSIRGAAAPRPDRVEVPPGAVPEIQAWLDRIDRRLTSASGVGTGSSAGVVPRRIVQALALASAALAALATAFGFAAAALAAAWVPRRPVLAAAGVTGLLASLAMVARMQAGFDGWPPPVGVGGLALASAALAAIATQAPTGGDTEARRRALSALSALVLVAVVGGITEVGTIPREAPLMGLHLWARTVPWTMALLAGCGLGLLLVGSRAPRAAGALVLAAATVAAALGLPSVRTASGDLLATRPSPLDAPLFEAEPVRTVRMTESVATIRVDPGGQHLLVGIARHDPPSLDGYRVEASDGWRRVEADRLEWSAPARAVGLRAYEGVLFELGVDGSGFRETRLGPLEQPDLAVHGGSWTATALDAEAGRIRVFRGVLDSATDSAQRGGSEELRAPEGRVFSSVGITAAGAALTTSAPTTSLFPLPGRRGSQSYGIVLAAAGGGASVALRTTALWLQCENGRGAEAPCVAWSEWDTEVWAAQPLASPSSPMRPLFRLPGRWWAEPVSDGMVLDNYRDAPLWVGGDPLEAARLPLPGYEEQDPAPERWRQAIDVSGEWLAVAWRENSETVIEIRRLRTRESTH